MKANILWPKAYLTVAWRQAKRCPRKSARFIDLLAESHSHWAAVVHMNMAFGQSIIALLKHLGRRCACRQATVTRGLRPNEIQENAGIRRTNILNGVTQRGDPKKARGKRSDAPG